FNGRAEPEVIMGWLAEIEDLFHLLRIKGSQRVVCATLQLTLRAYDWWAAKKQEIYDTEPNTKISWEVFRGAFLEQYVPRAIRRQKEDEFMMLKQGNLSVDDYDSNFSRLAKFAGAFLPNKEASLQKLGYNSGVSQDRPNYKHERFMIEGRHK
ncbi:hypothetical protein ACDT16_13885, partial [Staphylococcus aureus]